MLFLKGPLKLAWPFITHRISASIAAPFLPHVTLLTFCFFVRLTDRRHSSTELLDREIKIHRVG